MPPKFTSKANGRHAACVRTREPRRETPAFRGGAVSVASIGSADRIAELRRRGPPPSRRRGAADLITAAGKVSLEVLQHLASIMGSEVKVTLEIEAYVPHGIPDGIRRAVDENSRTLRFQQHGFEES